MKRVTKKRFHVWWILVVVGALVAMALSGCTVRFPIGEGGRYGTALVGYEPPSTAFKKAPAAKRNGLLK